jgi:hypothetical protein
MTRTSHANVQSLPDAAQTWNFDLRLPSIPGSSVSPESLTFKCKSTSLPSSAIEPIKIELHGVAKQEAGRATYEHTYAAVFLETIDYETLLAFRQWRDRMRSWKRNSGANSTAYKVRAELDLYDNAGTLIRTVVLVGSWPTAINEVQYDGAQSAAVELTVVFSFDYLDDGASF